MKSRATSQEVASRNRTLSLTDSERCRYESRLVRLDAPVAVSCILDKTINQDTMEAIGYLPASFVDLLFLDPPYNLTKTFGTVSFKQQTTADYLAWLEGWFPRLLTCLKPTASIYVCGDWRSSAALQMVAEKYLTVRNRITWEREKGRGAARNWKNCSEDIWFCTVSDEYCFNLDAVKLRRRVVAPYRNASGCPKDWQRDENGATRLTCPSNLWTDITVPFWSMGENTNHPTQKPEKLLAKLVLASSNPGDVILDPFVGSGTTSAVACKLGRHYVGIELDREHCCITEKRLALAARDNSIQGYSDGVFWDRNSAPSRPTNQPVDQPLELLRLEGLQ